MNTNQIYTITKESATRIATRDIDDTIVRLENAYSEGRLLDHELEERMMTALTAKTQDDLNALLKDLGTTSTTIIHGRKLKRLSQRTRAIFGGVEQKGDFILPKIYHISAIMGGCLIDLSEAKLESPESIMHITAIMGGVQVLVPPGIRIVIDGTPILAGIAKHVSVKDLASDAPTLRIHCLAVMGGIEIKSK